MAGVAVNVTAVPAHILVAVATMLTAGVTAAVVTVIVSVLDMAVGVVAQTELLVITQETTSPLAGI